MLYLNLAHSGILPHICFIGLDLWLVQTKASLSVPSIKSPTPMLTRCQPEPRGQTSVICESTYSICFLKTVFQIFFCKICLAVCPGRNMLNVRGCTQRIIVRYSQLQLLKQYILWDIHHCGYWLVNIKHMRGPTLSYIEVWIICGALFVYNN